MAIETHPLMNPRLWRYRVLCLVLSFFIPFLVVTIALIALHVTPFGDHSLAITDAKWYLNGQMFFARLMRGEEGLLYSFSNGIGANEWSTLSWGAFAPVSLLSLLATLETMPDVFTWIAAVNIALCGFTMYIMLARIKGPQFSHLLFSTSYALMGFTVVNCYQTLFFMGPQMLPLVMLGLYQLLRGKPPILYVLSLAICIFCNFYFGFMLCVAVLVFSLGFLYIQWNELAGTRIRLFLRGLIATMIAVLLAAPMWLPALKAFSGGGRLDQTVMAEYSFKENMPFIQMFSKLFSGANSTQELVSGMPNIFCGILVVALVILFFMNDRIEVRRKRTAAVILGFYLLTFFLPALTIIMHGGTHTNWFPYRYSFVFSFFLICIAAEEFAHLDTVTLRETKRCGVVLLVSILIVFSTSYDFIEGGCVVLDLALLVIMWLAFRMHKMEPEKAPQRVLTPFLLIIVCGNLYANFIISTSKVQEWELDLATYQENAFVNGVLAEAVDLADDSFYRMEKDVSDSDSVGADPYLYNYNGISHSGPTERMFVHIGLQKLGINWYDMRHWYSEGVPAATDALLGLKYLISDRDLTTEKGYEQRVTVEGTSLFKNENALSIAILADANCKNLELGDNLFKNLNDIWRTMTGTEKRLFTIQEDITYSLRNSASDRSVTSGELADSVSIAEASSAKEDTSVVSAHDDAIQPSDTYIEYAFTATETGPIYLFDTSIPSSPNGLAVPAIKYCGYYEAGDAVVGSIDIVGAPYATADYLRGYCANLAFATADNNALAECASLLKARDISLEVPSEDHLTGSFTAEPGQCILFTIPWDEGWKCYIDGELVPIAKTWDLFMSVEAPEGHHTWEMQFFPAWMDYGLYLCGVGLAGLLAFMFYWNKRGKGKPAPELASSSESIPDVVEPSTSSVAITPDGGAALTEEAPR